MKHVTLEVIEEILEGKISKNPNRFEEANGIMFSVNRTDDNMRDYFNDRGVEYHELVNDIYYTETIMSEAEFEQLDYVMNTKFIA